MTDTTEMPYPLIYEIDFQPPPRTEVSFDAILVASVLYPPDGSLSMLFSGTRGDAAPLCGDDYFEVWRALGSHLQDRLDLDEGRRLFCKAGIELAEENAPEIALPPAAAASAGKYALSIRTTRRDPPLTAKQASDEAHAISARMLNGGGAGATQAIVHAGIRYSPGGRRTITLGSHDGRSIYGHEGPTKAGALSAKELFKVWLLLMARMPEDLDPERMAFCKRGFRLYFDAASASEGHAG